MDITDIGDIKGGVWCHGALTGEILFSICAWLEHSRYTISPNKYDTEDHNPEEKALPYLKMVGELLLYYPHFGHFPIPLGPFSSQQDRIDALFLPKKYICIYHI